MTDGERNLLSSVTIVGMRFYPARDYLIKVSQLPKLEEQCLYLVAEVDNSNDINAVMLHNGKQKLGNVTATQAPAIKRLFTEWRESSKSDDVIVCKLDRVYERDVADFPFKGSIQVRGKFRVNERLARKFADKHRKD